MTCEDVREHLLTADIGDIAPVQTHLSRCARCAELAAAVAQAESDLRQHVENFVNCTTLDAQWAQALDSAGPVRGSRLPLHRLVLAAAAAAVLAVIAVPALRSPGSNGPPEPPGEVQLGVGNLPEALREARDRVEAFERIDTEQLDVTGLDWKAEDQLMRSALQTKTSAMARAEEALTAAASAGEARWRVLAYRDLGDLYAEMAEALRRFHQPSYLTDLQRSVYQEAIAAKVMVQQEKAAQTYERGADLARQNGLDAMAAELEALAAGLQEETAHARQQAAARNRERLRTLSSSVPALRSRLEANASCIDAAAAEALRTLLDQADRAIEKQDAEMTGDLDKSLSEMGTRLDHAIATCR